MKENTATAADGLAERYARQERRTAQQRRERIREIIRSALKNERSVTEWIGALEKRLGMAEEQPMDAMVIAFLVHRLTSIQCATCLAEEYGVTGETPSPFLAPTESANPFPKGSAFNP